MTFQVTYVKGYINDKGFVMDQNSDKFIVVMNEADWIEIKKFAPFLKEEELHHKVSIMLNKPKETSGERGNGVGDGSDPKKCSSLPIERRQPSPKTNSGNETK